MLKRQCYVDWHYDEWYYAEWYLNKCCGANVMGYLKKGLIDGLAKKGL